MAKNNCSTPSAVNTTPDAFSIPSILILLPNGSEIEVSWITFKCLSIFSHATGEITQARGDLALIAFLRGLLLPAPVLVADVKVAACADRKVSKVTSKKPSDAQIAALNLLADGRLFCLAAGWVGVFDLKISSLPLMRHNVATKTFNVLKKNGWIEEREDLFSNLTGTWWKISGAGWDALIAADPIVIKPASKTSACAEKKESKVKLSKAQRALLDEMGQPEARATRGYTGGWTVTKNKETIPVNRRTMNSLIDKGLVQQSQTVRYEYFISIAGKAALASDTPKTAAKELTVPNDDISHLEWLLDRIEEDIEAAGDPSERTHLEAWEIAYFQKELTKLEAERDEVKAKIAAHPDNQPKTPACAMRTPSREHRIAVKNGEMSRELTIAAAVTSFTRKYGYAPSLIKLHSNPLTAVSDFGGIEIQYSDAIPSGRVWLGDK